MSLLVSFSWLKPIVFDKSQVNISLFSQKSDCKLYLDASYLRRWLYMRRAPLHIVFHCLICPTSICLWTGSNAIYILFLNTALNEIKDIEILNILKHFFEDKSRKYFTEISCYYVIATHIILE